MRYHGRSRIRPSRRHWGAACVAAALVLTGLGASAASAAVSAVEVTAKLGGDPVTIRTVEPGQDAIVVFQAEAGRRALIEATDIQLGSMWVYLRDTTGATLRQASCSNGVECVLDTADLTATGQYSVYLDTSKLSFGLATIRVHEVPPDLRAGYAIGDPATTITTEAPGQDANLVFKGGAGQRVFTRISAGTVGTITAYLLDPKSSTLGGGICDVPCDIDTSTLPEDGEYRVLLSPAGVRTGSLTVQVLDVPEDFSAVTGLGKPAPVTTAAIGQNARVLFDANAGDKVTVAVTESGFSTGRISIHGPAGETLATGDCTRNCALTGVPLTASGTHTVLLDPSGAQIGTAVVTITVSAPDVLVDVRPGDAAVTLRIVEAGQNAAVRFTGTARQHVSAVLSKGSLTKATASLRAPDGTVLASAACAASCFLDVPALPADGRYTLYVDPDGSNTGSIVARVHDVPADAVVTAVPGGPSVLVATAVPGQNASAEFPVRRGERTFVQLSGGTYGSLHAYLRDPSGTDLAVLPCPSSCAFDVGAAAMDGAYRIALDPLGADTGGISVRVHAVPADSLVRTTPGGGAVTVATTVPGQAATVVFEATTGQRLSARVTGGTFGGAASAQAGLRRPDGSWLVSPVACGNSCFLDAVTADATGTYTLFIDPSGAAAGSATVQIHEVPADATAVVAAGRPASVSITVPGQNAAVTLDGTAGQIVTVTIEAGLGATTYQLRGPDGALLAGRTGTSAATVVLGPVTLAVTGTQTLTLNPTTYAVGSATVTAT